MHLFLRLNETGKFPVTPDIKGKPVALVNNADDGVPSAGVVRVGEFDKTTLPDPVLVLTPVPPLATGKAVPEYVTPIVPAEVTGEFATVKMEGIVSPTLVTVPDPPAMLLIVRTLAAWSIETLAPSLIFIPVPELIPISNDSPPVS